VHEAVATEEVADKPDGEIVAELQKGYLYDDELLRPARVRVATRGSG
jgi:molecular chaperone GrpE (heat shock protein)